MKAINLWFAICLFLAMTFFPLFAIKSEEPQNNENKPDIVEEVNGETFRLYFSDSDKVTEISARDYIIGVVAGEMPLSYEPEALKAQAVAAYTYALFKKQNAAPDSKYDITAESGTDQKFATNNEIKEKCGENYDQLYKKLTQAVDSVLGQTITYQDKPIFAAYHSISSGKTEAANNVWAGSGDYLVPVESTGDIMSKDYLSEVKVSEEKFASELEKLEKMIVSPIKDDTDTQLAVDTALSRGAERIFIIGGLGGRLDHTLSSVFLLEYIKAAGADCLMTDGRNRVRILCADGELTNLSVKRGYKYLSLVSLTDKSLDVSVSGVFYPLDGVELTRLYSYAVSNEITAELAVISLTRGRLLVIESRD